MKKVLVSGISPSSGGVGRLMSHLIPLAEGRGYTVITIKTQHALRQLFSDGRYVTFMLEIWNRLSSRMIFLIRILGIRNAEVIYLHPQSIGWRQFLYLIRKNSCNKFYVMDTSFFCIQSYNYLQSENRECLRCLYNIDDCDSSCAPFPTPYSKSKNLEYIKELKRLSGEVHFFVQNENQHKLLKKFYGVDIRCDVIGMYTGEVLLEDLKWENSATLDIKEKYNVVFHGTLTAAKGFYYFIDLAKKLPQYTFFIPYAQPKDLEATTNMTFSPCSWETGLKEFVALADLVMCPSLWSASIEGAVLKSIAFNGNVAVVDTEFAFTNELPDNIILKLPNDTSKAAAVLSDFLSTPRQLSAHSKKWLYDYMNNFNVNLLFK